MAQDFRRFDKSALWFSADARNHICVTADMAATGWKEVGSHEVFTVSGTVRMYLWLVCTEALATSGSSLLKYGYDGQASAFINAGYAGNFSSPGIYERSFATASVGGFMADQWPEDRNFAADSGNVAWGCISTSTDVGYTIQTEAFTDGTLEFHCVWEPLSQGATVRAGSGGSL